MNVFELAHQVNDRLNGGDESKFNITFIIVNEFLSTFKTHPNISFLKEIISEGNIDDKIMSHINMYMSAPTKSKDKLSMINFFHKQLKIVRALLDLNLSVPDD